MTELLQNFFKRGMNLQTLQDSRMAASRAVPCRRGRESMPRHPLHDRRGQKVVQCSTCT
jgi:hypothetical protein